MGPPTAIGFRRVLALAIHFAVIFPLRHHYAQEDHIRPLPIRWRFFSDIAIDQANGEIFRQIGSR